MSEALILESVNPQYDNRLLRVQYEKNTSSEHVVYKNCFECQNINNLSSYCGLTDSRMSASDTDIPVGMYQAS